MDKTAIKKMLASTEAAEGAEAQSKLDAASLQDQKPTSDAKDFIGIHCSTRLKLQLQAYANIDGVTLSHFIREVLTMELVRLGRQEEGSRELLMRERRLTGAVKESA